MKTPAAYDPVLVRFRLAVAQAYGDRLDRAVLFGSRARGDFRPDSDYDIAVFIRSMGDWVDEVMTLAGIGTDILMDIGAAGLRRKKAIRSSQAPWSRAACPVAANRQNWPLP